MLFFAHCWSELVCTKNEWSMDSSRMEKENREITWWYSTNRMKYLLDWKRATSTLWNYCHKNRIWSLNDYPYGHIFKWMTHQFVFELSQLKQESWLYQFLSDAAIASSMFFYIFFDIFSWWNLYGRELSFTQLSMSNK